MLKESFVWISGSLQGSRIRMGMRTVQRWTHKMRVMGWVDSLKTTMMMKLLSTKRGWHGGLIQNYWWLDSVKTTLRIQNEIREILINGFEIDWEGRRASFYQTLLLFGILYYNSVLCIIFMMHLNAVDGLGLQPREPRGASLHCLRKDYWSMNLNLNWSTIKT